MEDSCEVVCSVAERGISICFGQMGEEEERTHVQSICRNTPSMVKSWMPPRKDIIWRRPRIWASTSRSSPVTHCVRYLLARLFFTGCDSIE